MPFSSEEYYTDQQLFDLAVELGVVSKDNIAEQFRQATSNNQTIIAWILMPREAKATLIVGLKEDFKEKEGVSIKNLSEYYIDQINGVIYKSMKGDKYFSYTKKGLGVIFKTIAIQEGDYDTGDGKSKVEILKSHLGEKFEWYKETFPDKYQYLVEMDKERK
ncbi:MAG: hypothetical protein ABIH45_03820 [Candidatus Omnitrophota bacterium]